MKSFALFFVVLFTMSLSQAYTLIRAKRIPGFEPSRIERTFTLDSSGVMTLRKKDFAGSTTTTVARLGDLSNYTVNRIKAEIAAISTSTPLVDQDPGSPECTDTPEYIVEIFKAGNPKPIYRTASCKEFRLETYEGTKSINLALGFLDI